MDLSTFNLPARRPVAIPKQLPASPNRPAFRSAYTKRSVKACKARGSTIFSSASRVRYSHLPPGFILDNRCNCQISEPFQLWSAEITTWNLTELPNQCQNGSCQRLHWGAANLAIGISWQILDAWSINQAWRLEKRDLSIQFHAIANMTQNVSLATRWAPTW